MIDSNPSFIKFSHPLLKIAVDNGRTAKLYKKFNIELKRTLNTILPFSERCLATEITLSLLAELNLRSHDLNAFSLEWLRHITPDLNTPVTLEALAFFELKSAGFAITHPWGSFPFPTYTDLIPILDKSKIPTSTKKEIELPSIVVNAWLEALTQTEKAISLSHIRFWTKSECWSALRILVLKNTLTITPSDCIDERLIYLQTSGSSIWSELTKQLNAMGEPNDNIFGGQSYFDRLLTHVAEIKKQPVQDNLFISEPSNQSTTLRVIKEKFPTSHDRDVKEQLESYRALQEPISVARMPSSPELNKLLSQLEYEFPWGTDAVKELDELLTPASLLGVQELTMKPILLVGPPGSGKSRFARRLSELLKLPFFSVPCGGSSDSKMLTGTARGWSSADVGPLVKLMLQHKTATIFTLLDEIDKTDEHGSTSPPISSILLSLCEPETAARWRDGFLQVEVDLSRVIYIATANSLQKIPRALLSRFKIILLPEPGEEHISILANNLLSEIERDWGLLEFTIPRPNPEMWSGRKANAREVRARLQSYLAEWARETLSPTKVH
jgi:hypothetical protein